MNDQTYTATGLLNLSNNQIVLTVALPNPPLRSGFNLSYYNLSKKSTTGVTMNVVLCQFTFSEDPGNELPSPTPGTFGITLDLNMVSRAPGLAGVIDFDFVTNPKCLFLFFHSTDANADDRQAFFDDMESLYTKAQSAPYVMCPAPVLRGTVAKGRPRALGTGAPIVS